MKMDKSMKIATIIFVVLVLISLVTPYYGSIDVDDYAGVAKFFAGKYHAKIRTSHSILYGWLHAPLVWVFNGFLLMKIASLIWLGLIILSVYHISNKDKRTLFLFLISPIVWYMGPWINPIQLASLIFLWSFFFMEKYNKTKEPYFLIYSGILAGLSWALWNAVVFIIFFLIITYFYGRNVNHLFAFILFTLVGFLPIIILDLVYYSLPFYSTLKYLFGLLTGLMQGSIYSNINQLTNSLTDIISYLIFLPLFGFVLFKKKNFKKKKRQIIFLALGFAFFLLNPQVRYVLFLWPILMLYLPKALKKKQVILQAAIFLIISILVINPYLFQIGYDTNSPDIDSIIRNAGDWTISNESLKGLIIEDLNEISKDYPNETFVVGNKPDDYVFLANAYWGEEIEQFVSMQDYELYLENETSLFEKRIQSNSSIDRRQIWIGGGLERSENITDYDSISLGIGFKEELELDDFDLVKEYNVLYLSEKD